MENENIVPWFEAMLGSKLNFMLKKKSFVIMVIRIPKLLVRKQKW